MKINTNLLENNVIPKIKKGKNNLEDAYDTLASTSVPSDFGSTYKQKLKKAKTSIDNLEDDLSDLKTYVSKKCNSFDLAETKNIQLITKTGETLTLSKYPGSTSGSNETTEVNESSTDLVEDAWFDAGAYITQKAEDLVSWVSEKASQARDQVKDQVKAVVADIGNIICALGSAIAVVVEGIVDAVAFVGAIVGTIGVGAYDIVKGIVTGNLNFDNIGDLWDAVGSFIAEDHAQNLSDWFYGTAAGQWLDENAHSPFKSDGIAYGIAEAIGEVAAVVLLTFATAGIGTAVTGTTITASAGLTSLTAGISYFGQGLENAWSEAKAELGEDWMTWKTWVSGTLEGVGTGALNAAVYYFGSKAVLSNFNPGLRRLAVEAGVNAVEIPGEAAIDTVSSLGDKSFSEAFGESGGILGMLTCAVVGGFSGGQIKLTKYAGGTVSEAKKSLSKSLKNVDSAKLDEAFDKINVPTSTPDGKVLELYGEYTTYSGQDGFCITPENVDTQTVSTLAVLNLKGETGKTTKYESVSKNIAEYISTEGGTKSSSSINVKNLSELCEIIDQYTGKEGTGKDYLINDYLQGSSKFADTINEIMDDSSYWDKISYQMNWTNTSEEADWQKSMNTITDGLISDLWEKI